MSLWHDGASQKRNRAKALTAVQTYPAIGSSPQPV
jgi:hypothetical protein